MKNQNAHSHWVIFVLDHPDGCKEPFDISFCVRNGFPSYLDGDWACVDGFVCPSACSLFRFLRARDGYGVVGFNALITILIKSILHTEFSEFNWNNHRDHPQNPMWDHVHILYTDTQIQRFLGGQAELS